MVAAFDYCLHGRGGAAPSIDTAMHGLVDAAHVDHLHPDSGIALATAADGEALTARCFGDRVAWVPWRRPGFQLGLDIAAIQTDHPQAIGVVLGGHGITAWGDTSRRVRGATRSRSSGPPRRSSPSTAGPSRSARSSPGYEPLPADERRARAAALLPVAPRPRLDRPAAGRPLHRRPTSSSTSWRGPKHPRLAALGTSCPDHFLRTKVRPLVVDLPPTAPLDEAVARLRELHAAYRDDYARLLRAARRAGHPADARRRPGDRARARRRHVQLRREQADGPGRRRVLRQRHQRDARRRGACRPTRRSPSRRSSASSTGRSRRPSSPGCRSRSRWPRRVALVTGAGSGHRQGHRPPARRRGRLRRRRRHRRRQRRRAWPPRSADRDVAVAVDRRRDRRGAGRGGVPARRCSRSAASTSSSTTPACRSPSRCSRRPSPTGTSSTTSWPGARSSSPARRPGS